LPGKARYGLEQIGASDHANELVAAEHG
jgi:hypothetical protein